MLRLVAKYGEEIRRLPFGERREVSIGSAEGNDFVVPFPGVSRRHARAEPAGDGLRLIDLDSKNGLVVDGELRPEVALRPGGCVVLGRALLYVEMVSDADLEVALLLDGDVTGGSERVGRRQAGETAPHWALHLVRELDHLSPDEDETRRAGVLARTARAVGADGLWTFAVVEDDYFLRDFVGAVPSDEAVARVMDQALGVDGSDAGTAGPVLLDGPRGPFLACPPPGGEGLLLVATFPAEQAPAEWVGELMADVAERLRSVEAGPRVDDLAALVHHFALQAAGRYGKRVRGVGRGALERIQALRWEGRLRELEHAVAGAVLRCPQGEVLEAGHFVGLEDREPGRSRLARPDRSEPADRPARVLDDTLVLGSIRSLEERMREFERDSVREALERVGGDRERAADLLGVTPRDLASRMDRLGLDEPD